MVERFFAEITRNRIRRGAFKSVAELKRAITGYLENRKRLHRNCSINRLLTVRSRRT
jgi:hypothetical protein